jgi:hypothetical protein
MVQFPFHVFIKHADYFRMARHSGDLVRCQEWPKSPVYQLLMNRIHEAIAQ